MTRMTEGELASLLDRQTPITRRPRRHPETVLQRAVCQFWTFSHPDTWAMTFHCPNGIATTERQAALFKGLGVKPGVFDLLCIARRGPYNGLALELKATDVASLSERQSEWQEHFISQGWLAEVAGSLEFAIKVIDNYHSLPPRDGFT